MYWCVCAFVCFLLHFYLLVFIFSSFYITLNERKLKKKHSNFFLQPDIYVLIYSFSIGFFPFGFISNIWTYLSWWYSSIWLILLLGLILFLSLWSIQWSRVLSMGLWCKLTYNPFFIGWRPSYTLVTYLLRRKQDIIGGGAGARKWNEMRRK